MVPQKDPLGILGEQPKEKKQADPLGILKKKEVSGAELEIGGKAGTSEVPLVSEKPSKGFEGLKPAKVQPVEFKEPSVGEDTVLARKLAKQQRAAAEGTGVRLPAAPIAVTEEKAAERAAAPKIEKPTEVKEQSWLSNTVSALDKGFYKNLIGNPVKGLATIIQYGTSAMTGGKVQEGPISDALMRFGNWFNNAIDEVTPQDPEFKNSLSDQFAQALGQVGSMVLTGGIGAGGRGAAIAEQAIPKTGKLASIVAATKAGGKELVSEIASPAAVSASLTVGQSEFERAKQAGATDDQAFEAFYKNAAVGSILEKVPVMQFFKRFNNATQGGVVNYLKTKGVAGLTGGAEEMTTEVLQQLYANKTAQDIYNVNQDIFEGLTESGGIGFGVGFLLNAMGARAKVLRNEGKEAEAKVVEDQVKEFESRASKGAPAEPEAPSAAAPVVEEIKAEEVVVPQAPQTEETLNRYLSTYRRQLAERRKELTEQGIEDIEADEQVKNIKTKISNTQERISKLGEVPPVAEEVRVTTPEAAPQVPATAISQEIADLRAEEQAEYAAMGDSKDEVKRKEIYDKYDKLITPLLEKEKEVPAAPEIEKKSDADIEKRMQEIEESAGGIPSFQTESGKEYDFLEKEMEKREKASVFNVTLDKVNEAVDALIKKEKEMPNGYGAFIEMKDARETKSVANKYLNPSELSDNEIKNDFANAVMGNPDTWYADGLKLRESLKEAANRGIDTQKMVDRIVQEFVRDGFTEEEAKNVVARQLAPIFEGSKKAKPELPAAPIEEELPFGEVAPREAVETKEERNLTKRALNIEASTPIGEVFQYFISGGKISPEALTEFFGKERRLGMGKIGVEERRSRTSLTNKNAPSIEALAEKIAGTDRLDQVQEYREAIEEALLNHSGTKTMAEELVRDYDVDFTEMKRAAELEELGKEVEAETQAFVSQIPAAQQQEIMRVLDRFRGNDGFIDWKQIDEEIKGGFEPVLLELSEPSQKIINDAIKQFSETGRVGRISPEVISEEKIKEVKPETYAIQKPTAGEVPVQPEAGVSRKVEEGKPSTKPEEAPEEGKAEGKKVIPPVPPKTPKAEEEAEYTPRERNKALLDKLFKAKDIPEDAKLGFEKEGLRYQTKSQKEAELVAKGIIDEIGIDEALQLADSFEFDGDVNSLIYAESLNRLAKMEREAKSPEQKKALAKKFAEVGIEYDLKSRYGGRFNAAINYFYEKSPLGIVIMEDTKRREEFNKFASGKEQSWKEAHDIIKAELDALKIELAGKKTDPSIRTSEAKIEAARKKRAAIKEKYKKGKGGGLTLTTGGLTKEGIEYVGELVATYIQEGVANVEVIVQKIFLDFKDVLGKSLDEGTAKQVEEEVRKNYKDTKGKSVLDRVRKKLSKLSKKKQDEVIRKSFNQIIEAGALDYDDFRKIIAEVAGYSELTDQEKVRFEELVTKVNAVERAAEKARNERTEKSLKDFQKAEFEASKASQELNKLVWNKPDILKRLVSIMQLSTLGIAALINNPVYNMWNQATLRFPIGLVNDLIDRGVTLAAQETGTEYQREYNSLETQQEFFKKLGLGSKESFEQLVTGLSRQDYIQKEVGSQQIQPFQAAKDWWAAFTGKKNLTTAQVWDKAIQATAGLPAEAVARALNVGDKPQRFAAEGAQAAAFSKSLGLKDIDYELFIQFPQEEAYRAYKSKGFSDAEAAQKAQYVKDVIIKEGQRSTFQQDNLVNTALSAVFNVTFGRGKETGLANLVKATTVSPFIKIPTNAYWSYYNLLNPEVALLQSFIHGGRAFYINKTGEKYNAKLALRESRYWLGHFIVGVAIKAVVIALVKAGVYNAGSDEEESKRGREGKAFYEGQGTVNIDKLNAALSGQDPTQIKEGLLIPNRWFGQWGTIGNAIARKYENMTPEQRKNEADYYDFMLGELSTDVLQEMEQGVFANTSSLLSALNTGNPNRYFTNTLNMFTNIVHPATFAQLSRANLPNYTTQKADTFLKELENSMLTRSTFIRELTGKYPPSKVSIWGDPIAKQGGTVQKLFNITRVNKDMFARPLYDDAKKYNDINFFPPAVTSSLDGKQLTVAQTRTLQELVGAERKKRIAPYINDSAKLVGFNLKYSDLTDPEDKKKVLNYLYEAARKDAVTKFYNQYKDLKPKEKQKDFVKELQFDLFKTLERYTKKE